MADRINLQDDFLGQLRRGRHAVIIFTTNGFQLKGRVAAFDQFTVLVEDGRGNQNLVYKHAISTIVRDLDG